MSSIPYADELKRLVEYQTERGGTVLFILQMVLGEPRTRLALIGVKDGKPDRVLVENWNLASFALWEQAGYIKVVTGGLHVDGSTFRLTERGIEAAKKG